MARIVLFQRRPRQAGPTSSAISPISYLPPPTESTILLKELISKLPMLHAERPEEIRKLHDAVDRRLTLLLGETQVSMASTAVQQQGRVVSWRRSRPEPGWHGHHHGSALANPRPPAVPATLDLTLAEYFAAAGVIGLLSAQTKEPDMEWAADWAIAFGQTMAKKARRKRGHR